MATSANVLDQIAGTPAPTQAQAPPTSSADVLNQVANQPDTPPSTPAVPGEQTNDVGNTVIVPKDGESFSDTMARAAAQGKKTTPDQINKEIATMPGKAATVMAAAPVMGAAGVTAPLTPELLGAAKNVAMKFLAEQSPQLFGHEAVKETLKNYALEGLKNTAKVGAGTAIYKTVSAIWDDVFGAKKK